MATPNQNKSEIPTYSTTNDRAYRIEDARELLAGIGTSKIYELAGTGQLTFVKIGGRTAILQSEIDRYLASLPPAVITTQRRHRAGGPK